MKEDTRDIMVEYREEMLQELYDLRLSCRQALDRFNGHMSRIYAILDVYAPANWEEIQEAKNNLRKVEGLLLDTQSKAVVKNDDGSILSHPAQSAFCGVKDDEAFVRGSDSFTLGDLDECMNRDDIDNQGA